MKSWYAVYTQPRNEDVACTHLQRQGFEVYFPRYQKRRSHARRREMVSAPLFPRYLFVSFDVHDPGWRAIRSTRGAIDLVRNGIDPVAVPDGIVEEIRAREAADGHVVLAQSLRLERGDNIRIDIGAFRLVDVIFESNRGEQRIQALLFMLGRQVIVHVPVQAVVPAS